MSEAHIKTVYAIGAWVFDPLMRLWIKVVGTEAENELSEFLKSNLDESKTILELGCGTARNLETIFSLKLGFKNYTGIDFSHQMLSIARGKFAKNSAVEFREQDIARLDLITEDFDIILCTWVLSHIQSPSVFVNQAQSLLKQDGRLFLAFFTKPEWYISFWLSPMATYLFSARPVDAGETINLKM